MEKCTKKVVLFVVELIPFGRAVRKQEPQKRFSTTGVVAT
jgi:hypothetical protein